MSFHRRDWPRYEPMDHSLPMGMSAAVRCTTNASRTMVDRGIELMAEFELLGPRKRTRKSAITEGRIGFV